MINACYRQCVNGEKRIQYTTCRDNQWNPMFSEPKHNSVISYDEI